MRLATLFVIALLSGCLITPQAPAGAEPPAQFAATPSEFVTLVEAIGAPIDASIPASLASSSGRFSYQVWFEAQGPAAETGERLGSGSFSIDYNQTPAARSTGRFSWNCPAERNTLDGCLGGRGPAGIPDPQRLDEGNRSVAAGTIGAGTVEAVQFMLHLDASDAVGRFWIILQGAPFEA